MMEKDFQSGDKATLREVYKLVEDTRREILATVSRVEGKVDAQDNTLTTQVNLNTKDIANMQGRLMMIPTLISFAISVFFFIINYVLGLNR